MQKGDRRETEETGGKQRRTDGRQEGDRWETEGRQKKVRRKTEEN